jgi:hypothetical protein
MARNCQKNVADPIKAIPQKAFLRLSISFGWQIHPMRLPLPSRVHETHCSVAIFWAQFVM